MLVPLLAVISSFPRYANKFGASKVVCDNPKLYLKIARVSKMKDELSEIANAMNSRPKRQVQDSLIKAEAAATRDEKGLCNIINEALNTRCIDKAVGPELARARIATFISSVTGMNMGLVDVEVVKLALKTQGKVTDVGGRSVLSRLLLWLLSLIDDIDKGGVPKTSLSDAWCLGTEDEDPKAMVFAKPRDTSYSALNEYNAKCADMKNKDGSRNIGSVHDSLNHASRCIYILASRLKQLEGVVSNQSKCLTGIEHRDSVLTREIKDLRTHMKSANPDVHKLKEAGEATSDGSPRRADSVSTNERITRMEGTLARFSRVLRALSDRQKTIFRSIR
ncbi:hypothetical protein AAMO2058_000573700 [Amorphochlora amoebiformis]